LQPAGVIVLPGGQAGLAVGFAGGGGGGLTAAVAAGTGCGGGFWCAFEDGEGVVIGDERDNTIKDRRRPRLLYRGAKESDAPCRSRLR
jgi:hypothetical protein